MVYALHAGLGVLLDEGLEASWERHAACGAMLHEGLEALGLELFAEAGHRLPELTSVRIPADRLPQGVTEAGCRALLLDRYGIEVGGGLGPVAGQVWRIGLMGHTARVRNVALLLAVLGEMLDG